MSKFFANITLVLAALGAVETLAVAFGVNITPDQHTAIDGAAAAVLALLGIYFHPAIPIGPTEQK